MKRPHQVTSVVLILFSALLIREAVELEYYTYLGPGPGFFPLWLGIALGLLSAVQFYQATFRRSDPLPADFIATRAGYLRIGAIALALAGTVVLMDPLGFRLTTLLFYLFLLSTLGRVNPGVTVLVSLAGSFGMYHLFVQWLSVPLPIGIFGL